MTLPIFRSRKKSFFGGKICPNLNLGFLRHGGHHSLSQPRTMKTIFPPPRSNPHSKYEKNSIKIEEVLRRIRSVFDSSVAGAIHQRRHTVPFFFFGAIIYETSGSFERLFYTCFWCRNEDRTSIVIEEKKEEKKERGHPPKRADSHLFFFRGRKIRQGRQKQSVPFQLWSKRRRRTTSVFPSCVAS